MATYVRVHRAWHTGQAYEPVATSIKAAGHSAFTPTMKGNRPEDPRTVGLDDAIQSLITFLAENDLEDVVLVGHSYGGMLITGAGCGCRARAHSSPRLLQRLRSE
jgi:pimeloyl-ACP methyl ester carboxylesterase